MKKAIVLGIMAIFASSMVFAQPGTKLTKEETEDKSQKEMQLEETRTDAQAPNVTTMKLEKTAKGEAPAPVVKPTTNTIKKESKNNMGAVSSTTASGKTTLKTETVQPKPNFKESKNNMGEVANGKTTLQDDKTGKGVALESKNNMGAVESSKTTGKPKFGTADVDKKLKLKPKTIQENKPDAMKDQKGAINR